MTWFEEHTAKGQEKMMSFIIHLLLTKILYSERGPDRSLSGEMKEVEKRLSREKLT